MELDQYFRKSLMVFYSIEKCIAESVISNHIDSINSELVEIIKVREQKKGRIIDSNSVAQIVQAAFFAELIDIAVQCSSNLSIETSWKEFRSLINSLKLHEIRNRLAHSNRQFLLSDWYSIALTASSPLVDHIELAGIKKALIAAENNQLIDPPDDWLKVVEFEIPNNLPESFDHDLTGLVGRNTELKRLKKQLINQRISTVAIVAPGGMGKTAIALDLLLNFSKMPDMADYYDGIIFISLKLEEQTVEGIKILSAADTITALKDELLIEYAVLFDESYDDFEQLIESSKKKNLLLCIDNLETLLRDDETEFNEFNFELPGCWKVLITSRLDVTNSYTLPLEKLQSQAAVALARDYIGKRGGELDESQINLVAHKTNFNPLAIKLTLDYFIGGNELPTSLSKVSTDIAEFSFRNLVDSLSETAVSALEVLFIDDSVGRREICQYLEISIDESASAIAELSKTSLIRRLTSESREFYQLNGSVREFLLLNGRNIEVRKKVRDRINKNKDKAQEILKKQSQRNLSCFSELYIPSNTNEELKILLGGTVNQLAKRKENPEEFKALYRSFIEVTGIYDGEFTFHRFFSILYNRMGDKVEEKNHLQKALHLNPDDISAIILMAKFHHEERDYALAHKMYLNVIESELSEEIKEDKIMWTVTLNGYFLALLFSDELETIFSFTKHWDKDNDFGDILGAYRAAAYRKKLELVRNTDLAEINNILNSCFKIFQTVIDRSGYINAVRRESLKAIEDVLRLVLKKPSSLTLDVKSLFLNFCDKNLLDLIDAGKTDTDKKLVISNLRKIDSTDNPFYKHKWSVRSNPGFQFGISQVEYEEKQLTMVKISNIPKNDDGLGRGFVFAIDAYGESFFVHFKTLQNGNSSYWDNLERNDRLAIKYGEKESSGSARAIETYFVKEF